MAKARKPTTTLYLETSVWGMLAPGQPADLRRATEQLLARLAPPQTYVSRVVHDELFQASQAVQAYVLPLLGRAQPTVLEVTDECRALARAYLEAGVIPAQKQDDALHVAVVTLHQIDLLVSWNQKHLSNPNKVALYDHVNRQRGAIHVLRILTPHEVLHG